MFLKKLNLENFRCHASYSGAFSPNINVIVGNNAVGKTSIVESIYFIGLGRSYKTNIDSDVIKYNCDYAIVKGEFEKIGGNDDVTVGITPNGKKIKKNETTIKSISNYVGYVNVVNFCPEDVEIVVGSPQERRKFLDIAISQMDKTYLNSLSNYKKILKQRNEMLKLMNEGKTVDNSLLSIIDDELVRYGSEVILKRKNFIDEFCSYVSTESMFISDGDEKVELKYYPNTTIESFKNNLKSRQKYDVFTKKTSIGPHRDEVLIINGGKNVAQFGSQGQIRTAALSIKIGLSHFFIDRNRNVIIILDDVFSELDKNRQNKLIQTLKNKCQVFITTTSINEINDDLIKESKIINLERRD